MQSNGCILRKALAPAMSSLMLNMPDSSLPETAPQGFIPLAPAQSTMLEWNPNPVLVIDRGCRIRFVNHAAEMYGAVHRDALIGQSALSGYPAWHGSLFHEAYDAVLATDAPARVERYDDVLDRWHAVYAYPADGGVIAILEDVTTQRRAVESLRRSEETLRLAQEAANIGSFDFDLGTGVMTRSDQLLRLLGLEATDAARALIDARPRFDFVHPDDRAIVRASWKQVLRTDSTQRVTVRVFRVDGTERVMTSSAMQVRDPNGKPLRVVGTLVDITDEVRREQERKDVEAQLQQAQTLESLGVLAGGIAHDFNNLLVGILGNASLALLDLAPTSDARQCIMEIELAAQRAAELTRQLLAYAGKGRYVVESTDASIIISGMRTRIRSAISRTASLQMELMTSIPRIDVDVSQFRQVVMHLITNASESLNGTPGLISVRTGQQEVSHEYLTHCAPGTETTPGTFIYVEVHDDGTGMDEATCHRIFEPFFSTKFTGRGLGLAATIGIMRSHRGAIRVDSDMGSGTSVKLLFPVSSQQPIVPASTVA
jgi:two-component system cell cycle sensor histidine kinase/response regulator CckA